MVAEFISTEEKVPFKRSNKINPQNSSNRKIFSNIFHVTKFRNSSMYHRVESKVIILFYNLFREIYQKCARFFSSRRISIFRIALFNGKRISHQGCTINRY